MTDLHQPSDTATASGSADAGTTTQRFRGSSYEHALATATKELGDGVRVVEASRIRRGGLGGFFATDLGVEIAVVADERADREFSAEVMQLADGGMEGLLVEIERAERQSVRNVGASIGPVTESTPASFADHLADAEDSGGISPAAPGPSSLDDTADVPRRSVQKPRTVRSPLPQTEITAGRSARSGPGTRFEIDLADGEQQTEIVEAERQRVLTPRPTPEIEKTEPTVRQEPVQSSETVEQVDVATLAKPNAAIAPGPELIAAQRSDESIVRQRSDDLIAAESPDESIDELDALLLRAGVILPTEVADAPTAVEVMPVASSAPSTAIVAMTSVDLVAQTTDRLLSRLAAVVPAQGSCLDDLITIRVAVTTPDGTKVEMSAESGRRRD